MAPDELTHIALECLALAGGMTASAVATAAEISLLALHTSDRPAGGGARDNSLAASLLDDQEQFVLCMRAFNLCARLCAAIAAALLLAKLLAPGAIGLAFVAGGALILLVSIIFSELAPRSLPEASAHAFAHFLAPFAWLIVQVMSPLVWPHLIIGRKLTAMSETKDESGAKVSENELRTILSLGEIEGVIEEDTRDIIEGIFTLGDQVARELMTPRAELFALSTAELDDPSVMDTIRQASHNRALVFEKSIDRVVGVLDRKTVLLNPDKPPSSLMTRPLFVPDTRKLIDLLADMKRSRTHFAVVLDEYGGTAGVVTLRDMLHEIVGELEEDAMRGAQIKPLDKSVWLVSGRMEIERLNADIGSALPTEPATTVSGFIMRELGRLPEAGDQIKAGGLRLTVTRAGARRVAQARIELEEGQEGE
ncbi:MAG: hemolysin family protein [Candidatus Sumerlaeota bacterium]|nr:hemolysin family protein [Candidatus Sumerlaeota bacterium]